MSKKNSAAVALGRRGGKVKSTKKTAAARENGKKGGRPRGRCDLVREIHHRDVLCENWTEEK